MMLLWTTEKRNDDYKELCAKDRYKVDNLLSNNAENVQVFIKDSNLPGYEFRTKKKMLVVEWFERGKTNLAKIAATGEYKNEQ